MAASNPSPAGESKSLATVLVPVAGVALILVLIIVVGATNEPKATDKEKETPTQPAAEKLTDGTDPNADDPKLKDIGGGLKIRDLRDGNGPECPPGATVVMHYTGWLKTGKVFDTSRKRGEPLDSPLGNLIPGWIKGIPGMKVGGIRKLVIPPELAYGPSGRGGIPPNATLVFEVELLGIK